MEKQETRIIHVVAMQAIEVNKRTGAMISNTADYYRLPGDDLTATHEALDKAGFVQCESPAREALKLGKL